MREWFVLMLLISIPLAGIVSADDESDPLSDAGINIVALRNDSLDKNQDGVTDAIRVVIVLNSTSGQANLRLNLIGEHSGFTVFEEMLMSFENQENASLTYDSWATGEHDLTLEISDGEGRLLKSIDIGLFDLSPSLAIPHVDLQLVGSEIMQTGDSCEIKRNFVDETGPRWGYAGTRSITGTPFTVLDSEDVLDCSNWPAGVYDVEETYQNGLGQTAIDTMQLLIVNRPPPSFSIEVTGSDELVGSPCTIEHIAAASENHQDFEKSWDITPAIAPIGNTSKIDCSNWASGVYKILLTVTNDEEIRTTDGEMLIRIPSEDSNIPDDQSPVLSNGENTEASKSGIWGILLLSFVCGLAVFLIMVRSPIDDEIGLASISSPIEPDAEGLPTHLDESGILWRKHEDESLDWWDTSTMSWKRW